MFCNQCEQSAHFCAKHADTAKNTDVLIQGCQKHGICGKSENLADVQDALIFSLRQLSCTSLKAENKGLAQDGVNMFITEALYATLTNVNFSEDAITEYIRKAILWRKRIAADLGCTPKFDEAAQETSFMNILEQQHSSKHFSADADICSLMQILLYGVKGVAAYAVHGALLHKEDAAIYTFIKRALAANMPDKKGHIVPLSLEQWIDMLLECGRMNIRAMELLEAGHVEAFGHPVPTTVSLGQRAGKAIVVSGHDLHYLHAVLEQTQGTGIFVYTHGEMLAAHGYPKLKAFTHLAGHYGTAWQNQQQELANFPGAVLFTSNCIQKPQGYAARVFTCGVVHFDGLVHCEGEDFSALIVKAHALEGFGSCVEGGNVHVGFGRQTLLDASAQLLEHVAAGTIGHIFLVGGCDGSKHQRNYYTEFVEKSPKDSIILTLGCGKFRFFTKNLGFAGDFPRLMDVGQCNDAYAAVQVALALAKACNCSINDLPLSLVLSWYEQKAVSILLSLFALGVKNIYLGPSLPAFISPTVLELMVSTWNIQPIRSVDVDMQKMLAGKQA